MTAPGGPVCLEGSGDIDGDGIENSKDFCEHLAGGSYDEDLDGFGDECDACPIGKPPAAPESDNDGVDGPCDPDPRTPGHKIVLFNGFNAPLSGIGAAWKIQGGAAIMTPTTPGAMEQLVVPLPMQSTHMAILAAYRIDRIADGASAADAGVAGINELPLGTTSIECGSSRIFGGDQLRLDINDSVNTKIASNLFNPAGLYRLVEQLEGGTANCAVAGDSEGAVLQGNFTGEAMNRVAIYARGATARFGYLLVVER